MAYRDPYADQYGGAYRHDDFNPYMGTQQAYPTYDQGGPGHDGGYRDDPLPNTSSQRAPHRQSTMRSFLTSNDESTNPERSRSVPPLPVHSRGKSVDETSGFEQGEFGTPRGGKSGFEYKENLWTKGSRARCFGRFFCCTLMILVYLVISIILALALWIRPPSVTISDVQTSGLSQVPNGVGIDLGVNISVNNPNYFSVGFKRIKAEIFYPINNTAIGGGTSTNIDFPSNAQTNFTFPFSINYTSSIDPQGRILFDLLERCGSDGGQLDVDYKITLGIRILMATVSPVVSNSMTFDCPGELTDILGGASSIL